MAAEKEQVTALAWLAHNSNWLTVPGGIATGSATAMLNSGNRQLLTDISNLYADYKRGEITRTAYHARRTAKLDQFRRNIGPLFERLLYPKKGVHGAMRQGIRLLPPQISQTEVARLRRIAGHAARGGVVLTGIGVAAGCVEIAHARSLQERNEIFVETVASTAAGFVAGLFIVSSPIGWGTAIVLAIGSSAVSYGAGKFASTAYNLWDDGVDLVNGTGLGKICR